MRIQHNIPAMNSYRNYTNNTSALAKNLEKLSSGYKINRAGDDAAGLAISEKMRAQITGLEVAQKNAKDGISLVQTAEGALTEVHDMLNRMYELAEQSANGTYDEAVDRAQLQKEISSLSSEIDRIADSSNFNGIKLLDGSLSGAGGAASGSKVAAEVTVADAMKLGTNAPFAVVAAEKQTDHMGNAVNATAQGEIDQFQFTYTNEAGETKNITIQVQNTASTNEAAAINYRIGTEGEWIDSTIKTEAASGDATADNIGKILHKALADTEVGDLFDITNTTGTLKFEAKTAGETKATVSTIRQTVDVGGANTTTVIANTGSDSKTGADAYVQLDFSKMKTYGEGADADTSSNADDVVFTVDGQKFAFANTGELSKAKAALGDDVTIVEIGTADAPPVAADVEKMKDAINVKLGYDAAAIGTNTQHLDFKAVEKPGAAAGNGKGLTLQIGDTAESFNKLTVSIKDMHVKAMGIGSIDISKQDGASDAMAKVKDAINYVSDVRGTLGATQNRLDHTINNLSVMQENIQDAESSIRDVDVAKEMMEYTKNNILVQSAQAMLAQANQLPQGVLQLLQ